MASIIRTTVIDSSVDEVWAAVRDFGALHERLASGFVTGTTMVGPRERQVTFFTGAVATEVLVGVDENLMRLAYAVVEGPMGSTHYNASAQIVPDGAGGCQFVWIIDVLPDKLSEPVAGAMDAGLQAMKSTLETAAGAAQH
jgi:hypothetical protein